MGFNATILADSINRDGDRLTTLEITFPRFVLSELNTHRSFSRNGASSRAIPVETMIQRVTDDPVVPLHWGKNQKGMVAESEIPAAVQWTAEMAWREALEISLESARWLTQQGVHKQIVNRLLEPFMWQTMIVSATQYANFFAQRCHPDAEPHLRQIACLMREQYDTHAPKLLDESAWHLPLIQEDEGHHPVELLREVSVARCARVSYLTHDGRRDVSEDRRLYAFLMEHGHWSPFEHVATPFVGGEERLCGNFRGWLQWRKVQAGECRTTYPPHAMTGPIPMPITT